MYRAQYLETTYFRARYLMKMKLSYTSIEFKPLIFVLGVLRDFFVKGGIGKCNLRFTVVDVVESD